MTDQTLEVINSAIEEIFFSSATRGSELNLFKMEMSSNGYLLEAYKQTFLPDNLVQSLSFFFKNHPAESCPAMYKLLLIVVASPNLSLENFKTLLSEITEVLPCLLRQEPELLFMSALKGAKVKIAATEAGSF